MPPRGRDAARHRHPPGRHHRALPADDLRAVARHPPRARRGVLRHPLLRRAERRARRDALRPRARGGGEEPDARDPRRRLRAVDRHAGRTRSASPSTPSKRTHHEMAVATRAIETPVGTLAAGTVAAQRFTWQGTVRGEPVITVAVNWLMGEEHLDPAWTFGAERERFEVEITGDPPAKLRLPRPAPDRLPRGAASATPASSRRRSTASRRFRSCVARRPGSRPTSTCRSCTAAPTRRSDD